MFVYELVREFLELKKIENWEFFIQKKKNQKQFFLKMFPLQMCFRLFTQTNYPLTDGLLNAHTKMRRKKKNTRYIVVRPVREACGFWKLKQNPPHTHMNVKALNELERNNFELCSSFG